MTHFEDQGEATGETPPDDVYERRIEQEAERAMEDE